MSYIKCKIYYLPKTWKKFHGIITVLKKNFYQISFCYIYTWQ